MNGAIDQTDMYGRVSVVDGTVRSSDVTVVVDNRTQETAEQVGRTLPSGTMQELGDGSDSNWIEAMVAAIQRAEAQEARRNLNDGQISPTSMIAVTLKNEDSDSANRAVASNAGNETVDDDASPAHFNSSGVEDDNGDDGHTLPIIVEAPLPIIWTHSEPTLWWWKQRQTKLLMGTLVLVVIGFSIALAFHRQASTDEQVAAVIVVFSSAAPSFSMTPSSSPEQFTTMAPALPWVTCAVDPDCGATLDTWMDISGLGIADLMSGTANLAIIPNKTERLGYLLEAPSNTDDNYVSRMKGWLKPPVTGEYVFWISSDDYGEFWMSSDDHPDNKVCMCFMPGSTEIREWTKYPEQESISVPLVAGGAYYFEVRPCMFFSVFNA